MLNVTGPPEDHSQNPRRPLPAASVARTVAADLIQRPRRADGHRGLTALARSIGRPAGHRPRLEGQGRRAAATEQPIDTGTAAGKCFLDMLGVFAEFETNLRKERQLEGIAKAKAAGERAARFD